MPTTPQPHITLNALSFHWPDGSPVFSELSAQFSPGRTGLIGLNGIGKSTLLKIIAGEISPNSGVVNISAPPKYLSQTLHLEAGANIGSLLGIRDILDALHRILGGTGQESDYETLGDAWDIESRAEEALAEIGLIGKALDRPVSAASGGEATLVALAGIFLQHPKIVLLDEPTNNLDIDSRQQLYAMVRKFTGTILVVSHDRQLLDVMDHIAELREGRLTMFGGNFSDYQHFVQAEQEAALRAVTAAEQHLKKEKRQRIET
ncbi:MAG: ATP-binding cassette domain-containing protein, partial [Microbacteriaceae bacterium]